MIDKFAETILSVMLSLMPVEKNFSYVPLDYCDEECSEKVICDSNGNCEKPTLSYTIFLGKRKDLMKENQEISFAETYSKAKPLSYLRRETPEEMIIRYSLVAQSISNVSAEVSKGSCLNKCEEGDESCQLQCKEESIWHWDRKSLAIMLLSIARHESGYKYHIQTGIHNGRGDCIWYKNGKRVKPWTPGAYKDPYSCKSVCLGQINVGKGVVKGFGWSAEDLVGTDLASTRRCLIAMSSAASRARGYCSSRNPNWTNGTFSLYGSGYSCDLAIMNKRSGTYWRAYWLFGRGPNMDKLNKYIFENNNLLNGKTIVENIEESLASK